MSIQDLIANLNKQPPASYVIVGKAWDGISDPTFPDHLILVGELNAALSGVPQPEILTVRVITVAGINVRLQPNGKVVGALTKDSTINVSSLQPVPNWYKVVSGKWADHYITANPEYVEKVK